VQEREGVFDEKGVGVGILLGVEEVNTPDFPALF